MTMPDVSAAALELYDALSPTWTDQDADYGWSLLWFCEALVKSGLQPVYDYAFDRADRPGWTILLDLDATPDDALPYLAQFVGVVVPPGNTAAQTRDLILNRPGWKRGTPDTLLSAVRDTLIGSKRATLTERDTNPYHATIRTYTVQTLDEPATLAAIAANKPAGLIIDLVLIAGPTFAEIQATTSPNTFAARLAAYPTFGDVLDYVP
jgi:hypothetical protein